jgi:UDP-N-acetylglucosamine diphosphorylase/glucosamine-1-phosphate N-acetyltransferase
MKLCIFEDDGYANFLPLTWFRPVYDLRCGINTLREKITRAFPEMETVLVCREYLAETLQEANPDVLVNQFPRDRYLMVNGRVLFNNYLKQSIDIDREGIYLSKGRLVAAVISSQYLTELQDKKSSGLERNDFEGFRVYEVEAEFVEYVWDLIRYNPAQIVTDAAWHEKIGEQEGDVHYRAVMVNPANIFVGQGARVRPAAVLDAEKGPIYIEEGATVLPNATIIGPAYIGRGSVIKISAKISGGTSIGEMCKVGGEVEASIIHSYSNKQHEGFLGHSYLGQWVNLGANTNNSDLKNNYQPVKMFINGKWVSSGTLFMGAMIGDHVKTGINTMLNTGAVIGVFSNLFGSGFMPKYVPAFSWGGADELVEHRFEKAIATARVAMARRKVRLTPAMEKLYRYVFDKTASERK